MATFSAIYTSSPVPNPSVHQGLPLLLVLPPSNKGVEQIV